MPTAVLETTRMVARSVIFDFGIEKTHSGRGSHCAVNEDTPDLPSKISLAVGSV